MKDCRRDNSILPPAFLCVNTYSYSTLLISIQVYINIYYLLFFISIFFDKIITVNFWKQTLNFTLFFCFYLTKSKKYGKIYTQGLLTCYILKHSFNFFTGGKND